MRETDTHVFFWAGEFSNWYPSEFVSTTRYPGVKFNCGEQFMMRCKADLFGDEAVADMIMESDDPHIQKQLGKTVKNFDKDKWEAVAVEQVAEGLYDKFTQNPHLKEYILSTGNKVLVEASPYDKIWGIGLYYTDDRVLDETQWQGTNFLGIALMKVRDKINIERRC